MANEGERCPLSAVFEADDQKRFKRFRHKLFDDSSRDAIFDVDGTKVRAHRVVLEASSSQLAKLGPTVQITGKPVKVVRDFVSYLYGINMFDDGEMSVESALDLVQLFNRFGIDVGAKKAAKYCVQKCNPGHLNKMYDVLGKVSEIRSELTKKIVENLDNVDVSSLDASMMLQISSSDRASELGKAAAIYKWMSANPKKLYAVEHLFKSLKIEKIGECAAKIHNKNRELEEEVKKKDKEISDLKAKLGQRKSLGATKSLVPTVQNKDEASSGLIRKSATQPWETNGPLAMAPKKKVTLLQEFALANRKSSSKPLANSRAGDIKKSKPPRKRVSIIDKIRPHNGDSRRRSNSDFELESGSDSETDSVLDTILTRRVSKGGSTSGKDGDDKNSSSISPSHTSEVQPLTPKQTRAKLLARGVRRSRRKWQHPMEGQTETELLHQVRALIKLRNMSQKMVALESGASQSGLSTYLRGMFKGKLDVLEKKLEVVVQQYLDGKNEPPGCQVRLRVAPSETPQVNGNGNGNTRPTKEENQPVEKEEVKPNPTGVSITPKTSETSTLPIATLESINRPHRRKRSSAPTAPSSRGLKVARMSSTGRSFSGGRWGSSDSED